VGYSLWDKKSISSSEFMVLLFVEYEDMTLAAVECLFRYGVTGVNRATLTGLESGCA
jgi:hypothetical protein